MLERLTGARINAKETKQKVTQLKEELTSLLTEAKAQYDETKELKEAYQEATQMFEEMCATSGGFIWYKDTRGRYLYANRLFCTEFYRVDDCSYLLGKTDVQLIKDFKKRTKCRHTYGELCMSTDDFTIKKGEKCRFIELGAIEHEHYNDATGEWEKELSPMFLEVIKTPVFRDNKIFGTVGFAFNLSDRCHSVKHRVEAMLENGCAQILDKGVYYIPYQQQECPVETLLDFPDITAEKQIKKEEA